MSAGLDGERPVRRGRTSGAGGAPSREVGMRKPWYAAGAAVLFSFAASSAFAADECPGGVCRLPSLGSPACTAVQAEMRREAAPSAREIRSAVDSYLAPASADATLVGGPGSAGYDGGFWIRGGAFLLKINLTIQTRWEGFSWDDDESEAAPGGDLSGFSLPRVTLKFSGDATCDVHYYAELEFGHSGHDVDDFDDA